MSVEASLSLWLSSPPLWWYLVFLDIISTTSIIQIHHRHHPAYRWTIENKKLGDKATQKVLVPSLLPSLIPIDRLAPREVQEVFLPNVRVDSTGGAAGARSYHDLLRVVHPVLHLE